MSQQSHATRNRKSTSFRTGRVRAYLRGRIWYLCYREDGRRHQPRVGPHRNVARQMAAEINAQLEVGTPSALWFQPVSFADLRQRWLDYHEYVLRSSVATIDRYRHATQHLLNFIRDVRPLRRVSDFHPSHAEEFVRYLRSIQVPTMPAAKRQRRPLRDAGVKYILETSSILFSYARKNRHLSPYAENPFDTIGVRSIPVEDARPITVFTADQEGSFLKACDDWQFPLFLTLLLTGLRSGELAHLLLPDDLDLDGRWLRVRNKPHLGWKVKTRNERDIPLMPVLADVLRAVLGARASGPVFRRRRYADGDGSLPALFSHSRAEREVVLRCQQREAELERSLSRAEHGEIAGTVWRDMGAISTTAIRHEFGHITASMGLADVTAPKTFRHTFATTLQDGNVDPLIRNELMGHVPAKSRSPGGGLAMTAVYTHTRPETKRQQLENVFANRAAVQYAATWLQSRNPTPASIATAGNLPQAPSDGADRATGPFGHEVDRSE